MTPRTLAINDHVAESPIPGVPGPGTITESDLRRALDAREAADRRVVEYRDNLSRLEARMPGVRRRLRIDRRKVQVREWADRVVSRAGAQLVLSTACPAAAVALVGTLTHSPSWLAPVIALGLVGSAVVGVPLLFWPRDPELAGKIELDEQEMEVSEANSAYLESEMSLAARSFDEADAAYRKAYSILHGRLHRLLSCPWQGFAGTQFEDFLADLFRERGYVVETTRITGDQGLDLILVKDGRRVGVQAKGYPGSAVGNKAVQEAHAGMSFYDCHASAVVTNSTFTRGCAGTGRQGRLRAD